MTVDVIALDFYDGATEGFAKSVGSYEFCYFKLIAWDDAQDERLFAAVAISEIEYDELVSILTSSEAMPASSIWIPKWQFENDSTKNRADEIVGTIQNRLRSSGFLLLGLKVTDSATKIREFDGTLGQQIGQYLEADAPDDLSNWSKYFK